MKKILILLIILLPLKVNAINASSYIVMDSDNNRVLEGSNINQRHLIASISKIMTSMVVINNGSLDHIVQIGDEVLKSFGSGIYISVGEHISRLNLLYGLMLRSGNDAAIALAYNVGGSMEGFVSLMNELASNIGMQKTTFINSNGLENEKGDGNLSTTYDMALLSSYAIQNKIYKQIVGTKEIIIKTDLKTYEWHNKNKLLAYKYCTGGKTGYTQKAKSTLVTNASKDNVNLTIVTFNDGNDFNDHQNLYTKYFNLLQNYLIIQKGFFKTKYNNTYLDKDFRMNLTKEEYQKLKIQINYYEQNVTKIIGNVEVKLDNKIYFKENIYLKKDYHRAPKYSFWNRIKALLW